MKTAMLALAALAASTTAAAESLRCEGGSVAEGESKLAVLHKCGEPRLRDSYCASAHYGGTVNAVPVPYAAWAVPCLVTEEWLYERGPGNLVATIEIRAGKVQSIKYGLSPR